MASSFQEAKLTGFAAFLPASAEKAGEFERVYEENRHRVYALAFWMTDNEIAAEELMADAFRRAFSLNPNPTPDIVDRALIAELRQSMPLGNLSLECRESESISNVRRNTMRVHLERAVVQLPATEKMVFLMHDVENYPHERIARLLGISEQESQLGLHQARLRIRELLASMVS